MLIAEPRAIIRRLNRTCTRALEAAAGACMSSTHYEVTPEHMLAAFLDDPASDVSTLVRGFDVPLSVLRAQLQRSLGEQRSGNTGRPVFSPLLLEWVQDAWIYASAELDWPRVRSGALFVRALQSPTRYFPSPLNALEGLPRDELRTKLPKATEESGEAAEEATRGPAANASPGAPSMNESDSNLARFTTDLTERARANALDPVLGRENEVRQLIDIVCRRRKNNPIIVGEPGVGKTALVEGLALRIAAGEVPEILRNTKLLVLDLGSLQAGAGVKGEFEKRLKGVIDEVKASPQPIVLFIDEAHTIIGAGGPQGGGDAANLLKPALARGELRTIAATTWAEYKRYFEKDAALERRFQPVKVDEPSIEDAIVMLRGLAKRFEESSGVVIQDEAVQAAVTLSSRYISGRQLPDKAVDLLDTAAARVRVVRGAPPGALDVMRARVAAAEREIGAQDRDEVAGLVVDPEARAASKGKLEDLRVKMAALEARAAAQRAIVARIDELRLGPKDAKDGAKDGAKDAAKDAAPKEPAPIDEGRRAALRKALEELRAIKKEDLLVHADVDETLISTIVSDWTGIPVGRMVKDDVAAILSLEDKLRERVRGQDGALALIARELRAARSGLKPLGAPLGVFLLVGPSGVGKTETALTLADLLFGGERFTVTINMSEFQERHTVSRLIGSPPGYVGYGEGGMLTEAVRQRPYSVVLLDEVEKADRDVMNLFYQVFDKGMLSDGEGRVIDFANTVVILTSNLATDLLTQAADPSHAVPPLEDLTGLVKPVLSAHFKPALLARMTVVPYVPIRADALLGIVRMKLGKVAARAKESQGVELRFDEAVLDAIASRCREVESGARNVDHILRGAVMPIVSGTILEGMAQGEVPPVLRLSVTEGGAFACAAEAK